MDLLLACTLANAACAVANIVTVLIFIIVSPSSHAFFLVVVVCSSLHVLVVVAANCCFQHTPAVRSNTTLCIFLWATPSHFATFCTHHGQNRGNSLVTAEIMQATSPLPSCKIRWKLTSSCNIKFSSARHQRMRAQHLMPNSR